MTHLEVALVLAGLLCFSLGIYAGLKVRHHRREEEERNQSPGILWKVPRDRVQYIIRVELADARRFQRKLLPDEWQDEAAFARVGFWLDAMYAEEGLRPWQERLIAAAQQWERRAPDEKVFPEQDYALRRLSSDTWRQIGKAELRRTESFARAIAGPGEFVQGHFLYVANWMDTLQEREVQSEQGDEPRVT
jgi:hypothetical protein